jgi:type IV pilus assembly protein PilA
MKIEYFKKIKAFTLIELLVVVAIIGILSAVGVVAYNGFIENTKSSTSKSNFDNIYKILLLETHKCSINGKISIMSMYNSKNFYNVLCSTDKFTLYSEFLVIHIENLGRIKNFYRIDGNAVQRDGPCDSSYNDSNIGYFFIRVDSSSRKVSTCGCYKIPCNDSINRFEKVINLDF